MKDDDQTIYKGGYVMLFSIFIKRLKMSTRQMNSKNNGQALLPDESFPVVCCSGLQG